MATPTQLPCWGEEALPELITEAAGRRHVASGLLDAFFPILIRKKDQKQFSFL